MCSWEHCVSLACPDEISWCMVVSSQASVDNWLWEHKVLPRLLRVRNIPRVTTWNSLGTEMKAKCKCLIILICRHWNGDFARSMSGYIFIYLNTKLYTCMFKNINAIQRESKMLCGYLLSSFWTVNLKFFMQVIPIPSHIKCKISEDHARQGKYWKMRLIVGRVKV